jgi:hypothetical protein
MNYQRECPGTSWEETMELITRNREIELALAKKRRAVARRTEEKADAAASDDGPSVDQPPPKRVCQECYAKAGGTEAS